MNEEIDLILMDAEEHMHKSAEHLKHELSKLRAGKASPALVEEIHIDYYGTETPIRQIANISVSDVRTIAIQPWEKNMIDPIERAIMKSNIGITPINNGEVIRLNIPALTEERRKDLVKKVKAEGESTKVVVRNIRRDANEEIKRLKKEGVSEDLIKDAEEKIQKITDKCIKDIDIIVEAKEKEILTV
jgi:ribosome recycling factor